jgi:hypothetical protein
MKNSKTKTVALILLAATAARAWIYWVGILMVVAFTAYVVYNLETVAVLINPENPPNNLNPQANGEHLDIVWVPMIPPMGPMVVRTKTADDSPPPPFTKFCMSYGMASDQGPWIRAGYNLAEFTNSPSVVVLTNTADTYSFTFTVNGQWWLFTATNVDSFDYGMEVTPIDGPTLSDTNCYYSVVIERSIDFQQWEPVFTNSACPADAAMIFIDTNAPFAGAFYRTVDLTSP